MYESQVRQGIHHAFAEGRRPTVTVRRWFRTHTGEVIGTGAHSLTLRTDQGHQITTMLSSVTRLHPTPQGRLSAAGEEDPVA